MSISISLKKKIMFSAVMVFGSLVLLAVLGEIALRVRYEKVERITGVAQWSRSSWKTLTYYWDKYHPTFGWTNVPNYESDERVPFELTINSQGLRSDRDYALSPSGEITRIAVFGDSCVFGEEVDDNQTLTYYLESHLQDVQCLNFGVHGYGLGQMSLRLEKKGFSFYPDHVVIVLLLPYDVLRTPTSQFLHNKPTFRLDEGKLVLFNVPVPEASRQPWLLRKSFVAAWMFGRPAETCEPQTNSEVVEISQKILKRIHKKCESRGIALTVVNMIVADTLKQAESNPRVLHSVDYMRQAFAAMEIDMLDLTYMLKNVFKRHGKKMVAPLGHWTGKGNCLIAESIAIHLAAQDDNLSLAADRPKCVDGSRGS